MDGKLLTMDYEQCLNKMLAILIIFMGSGVYASSMAAWATRFGTSLFVHNSSTGIISASMCNSSTLVFPVDPPNVLEIGIILSNRTGITAMGHYDGVTSWVSYLLPSFSSKNRPSDMISLGVSFLSW